VNLKSLNGCYSNCHFLFWFVLEASSIISFGSRGDRGTPEFYLVEPPPGNSANLILKAPSGFIWVENCLENIFRKSGRERLRRVAHRIVLQLVYK
jgi:hypothetical protein